MNLSPSSRTFDANGKIESSVVQMGKSNSKGTLTDYARAAQAVAGKMQVPFIDLHGLSIAHHNQIGPEASMAYNWKQGDTTHFNRKGTEAITDLILPELKKIIPELGAYLKEAEPQKAQPESVPLAPSEIAAYGKPGDQIIYRKEHLYVFNGMSSVGLDPQQFGVHRLVAPPYIANPFSADLQLFGQKVAVSDYQWYPSQVQFIGKAINGIEPRLQIVPLKSHRGALVILTLRNTTSDPLAVPIRWSINGGAGKVANWAFGVPRSPKSMTSIEDNSIVQETENARLVGVVSGITAKAETNSLVAEVTVAPGKEVEHSLVLVFGDKNEVTVAKTKALAADPGRLLAETHAYWTRQIVMADKRLPALTGASPELQAFYRVGVMSFLSTRHEVPEFLFNPYYAEAGIDGGAANSYLWGIYYAANISTMLDPEAVKKMISQFLKLDINKCYAFDPIHGKRQGPLYSYNYYSLAWSVYTYLAVTGDLEFMKEEIEGKSGLTRLYEACLGLEDLSNPPMLLDYGGNHNLLELRKTANYTHVTPSPNGERILTYRYLTEIYQALGQKTPHDLIRRGEELKTLYVQKLWNEEKQWLNTLDEKGNPRISYSIQIFDVLRTGMLSKQQEKGVLSHLNEKEFLSQWGVHSLAKTDLGYDPSDVDWGGPGAYTGDPTELVVDLCQAGYAEQGVDVLNRILWWGELPYLPQAMRANTKGYREDGRANIIAGGSTIHVVINGLFGVAPELDKMTIKPISHLMMDGLSLKGLQIHGRSFDVSVTNGMFTVTSDGKTMTKALGESVELFHNKN